MDITRNWRLKSTRTQILAARCPDSGTLILPQRSGLEVQAPPVFTFEPAEAQPRRGEGEVDYARAAR